MLGKHEDETMPALCDILVRSLKARCLEWWWKGSRGQSNLVVCLLSYILFAACDCQCEEDSANLIGTINLCVLV